MDSLNSFEYLVAVFFVCIIKTPLIDYSEQLVRISSIGARDYTTKKFAYSAWLNAISTSLYRENYEFAEKYIDLASKLNQDKANYNFRMNLRYLDHLTKYLKTGDLDFMKPINNFISILEDIGDHAFAQNVKDEVKLLTHNKGKNDVDKNKYGVVGIREN
ncbi:hypothetical protein GCM10011573_36860 [Enterococcus wangshanyuanii]|uniref:HTH-type transcriptional regulator Rgg C-terminal domain-containing protein n=1 Tax=Enterococcus wangshanyuanii TaxID=2005703 RepID=A0ABQ1PV18_9ENTE|nr:hypothetical protein GCM10011573_36860 [Enterococcus wangshanyuanii]